MKLSPNKAAAQQMLAELVKRPELEKGGVRDEYRDSRTAPLAALLAAYTRASADRGNTAKQTEQTAARCRRVFDGCRFAVLNDLDAEQAVAWLAGQRSGPRGFGPQTSNHYTTALKAFGNWPVRARKAAENPFRHMVKVNTETDVRHERRPLNADEFARLTATARAGKPFRYLPGADRAVLYLVAGMTGLRASELASLTPGSFALDADPPTVTVEAGYSKHRRRDVVALHPDLAATVRPWLAGKPAGERVWPGKWAANNEAGDLLKRDLAAARAVWLADATDPGRADRPRGVRLPAPPGRGRAGGRLPFPPSPVRDGTGAGRRRPVGREGTGPAFDHHVDDGSVFPRRAEGYRGGGRQAAGGRRSGRPGHPGGGVSACTKSCTNSRPRESPAVPKSSLTRRVAAPELV